MVLYTIGHSTRPIEEFLGLLKAQSIQALVDVRAFPGSRRSPQFGRESLRLSLERADIEYVWMGAELGGYRKESEGLGERSPNQAWKTPGFRIYADDMLTEKFRAAAARLVELAETKTTAYMCAEKVPWHCHRQLISDYLVSRGYEVRHMIEADKIEKHELTKFALLRDGVLIYPPREKLAPGLPLL